MNTVTLPREMVESISNLLDLLLGADSTLGTNRYSHVLIVAQQLQARLAQPQGPPSTFDSEGDPVADGDTISFSYGIPPVRVTAPVINIGGELWAITKGHVPDRCRLSELRECVGEFYKEETQPQGQEPIDKLLDRVAAGGMPETAVQIRKVYAELLAAIREHRETNEFWCEDDEANRKLWGREL